MNVLIESWLYQQDRITYGGYIPCKICGNPTSFTGTGLCNGCWEVTTRLHDFLCCQNAKDFVQETLKATEHD